MRFRVKPTPGGMGSGQAQAPVGAVPRPEDLANALRQLPLHLRMSDNLQALRQIFRDCSDLIIHEVAPRRGPPACVLYVDGLVDKGLVDRDIIAPLVTKGIRLTSPRATASPNGEEGQRGTPPLLQQVAAGLTTMGEARLLHTLGEVVERVLGGEAILLVDGVTAAVGYGVRGWESRSVEEPATETTIRGPREGFVETLRFNTALLRRKVKSPALKMIARKLGRISQTDLVVAYIHGLANPLVVREVLQRLDRIDVDKVLEGGELEELIQDSPFSPFPQVQNTERPDTAAAQLMEGRVAILVDGTPFVLIVPVVFTQFLQASEDYYERFFIGSALRGLRFLFLFIALLMPSIYIAIVTFHVEMLPASLLLSLQAAKEGVPFPALVEALIMEFTFEILREAGVRMPRPVGQAISIVGALVIGEAAVMAGLASAPMVIVVALTGIASFAIPKYSAAIAVRMLRFPMMFLTSALGMFGIMVGVAAILLHLCSLRSFGVPYLFPLAPLDWRGLQDTVLRAPQFWLSARPRQLARSDRTRTAPGLRPGPQHGGSTS